MALGSLPDMGRHYVCRACGRRLTVPEELFANKIRGRVVTVKCKGCMAPVSIDGTIPPPPVETSSRPSDGSGAVADGLDKSAPETHSSAPSRNETASDAPQASAPVSIEPASDAPAAKATVGEVTASVAPASDAPGGEVTASVAPVSVASASVVPASPARITNTWATDDPEITTTTLDDPTSIRAGGDEPLERLLEIDDAWETSNSESDTDRFSHASGPISVRAPSIRIGRYALFSQFAEGGVATVHFGRLDGAGGFSRVVAIKQLLPHLVKNQDFTEMLLKEARLAARVRHTNVVPTLDVVASHGDVFLVLEYIHGESLSVLCRTQAKQRKDYIPIKIAVAVMLDVLSGLCAVHEATDEKGRLLGLVHRDISPSNVIVGADGHSRILDFGIAKALEQLEESMPNHLKGKVGYMAPEQIRGEGVTQRSDVFSAGVVLWELLAMRRLFPAGIESDRMRQIVSGDYPPPSKFRPGLAPELDRITLRALAVDPEARFARSREFALALEQASERASDRRVAEWVSDLASKALSGRARMIAQVEHWQAGPDVAHNPSPFDASPPVAASSPPADIANARALLEEKLARVTLSPSRPPPSLARPRIRKRRALTVSLQLAVRAIVPFVIRVVQRAQALIRQWLRRE